MSSILGARPFCGGKSHLVTEQLRCRRRVLRVESLESRYALSSVAALGLEECASGSVATYEEAPAIEGQVVSEPAAEDPVMGPIEADAYYSAVETAVQSEPTAVAEGEAAGIPVIDQFEVDSSTMYWFVSGHITDDDGAMAGYVVRFGGLLEGHSTTALPDGSFFFYTMMPPGTTGTVEAVATDPTGLESNTALFTVG